MKKLNPGQIKIRNTGKALCLTGIIWLILLMICIFRLHTSVNAFSAFFVLITGFLLLDGGYVAARRAAFLLSASIALCLFLTLLDVGSVFYQLNLEQIKLFAHYDRKFLTSNLLLFGISIAQIWAYTRLSSKSIKHEMKLANIPYKPFWRYGTFRGAITTTILCLVILNKFISHTSLVKEALIDVDKTVRQEYGPSEFFIIRGIQLKKDRQYIDISFNTRVYNKNTFERFGVRVREAKKDGDPEEFRATINLK